MRHRLTGCVRRKAMSTRNRSDRAQPGIARRFLACFQSALLAVQPIAWATSACLEGRPGPGQEACCCSSPSTVPVMSCCSTEEPRRAASGTSILSPLSQCTCEMQAPAPFSALPSESGVRSVDRGNDSGLCRWIESGALASASTPSPQWPSQSGELHGPPICGLNPFRSPTAAILVRGPRGLLDLICVARC